MDLKHKNGDSSERSEESTNSTNCPQSKRTCCWNISLGDDAECLHSIALQANDKVPPGISNTSNKQEIIIPKPSLSHYNSTLPSASLPLAGSEKKGKESCTKSVSIRGIKNLGNTCFLNAVIQCLAQTTGFSLALRKMEEGGERFSLPGGEVQLSKKTVQLKPLEGNLPEVGLKSITRALLKVLTELKSGNKEALEPIELVTLIRQKSNIFADGGQHDSHELLRWLLDAIVAENLERHEVGILNSITFNSIIEKEEIAFEQEYVGFYEKQAADLLLGPAAIFQGTLLSILRCEKCLETRENIELFFDLSLSVENPAQLPVLNYNASARQVFMTKEKGTLNKCQTKHPKDENKSHATLAPRAYCPSSNCSLASYLEGYTRKEYLTGSNKLLCKVCTDNFAILSGKTNSVYSDASKQLLIASPPQILLLHVNKTRLPRRTRRENYGVVEFPLLFDLAPYCSSKSQLVSETQTTAIYSLYAVIEHKGDKKSGHYASYVKVRASALNENVQRASNPIWSTQAKPMETQLPSYPDGSASSETPNSHWIFLTDEKVKEVQESDVLTCEEAYSSGFPRSVQQPPWDHNNVYNTDQGLLGMNNLRYYI